MYVINVSEWKGKIASRDMSKMAYAKKLGISRNTLQAYFEDPSKVPYKIITKSIEGLGLSDDEARAVFFNKQLT